MDPDNKDFLKFLKKNRVKIISKEMQGPGSGTPVITMQGKRKDLENVLADGEYGWDDADLAEYIEESVDVEMISEAFKSSKLRNLMNTTDAAGRDIKQLAKAFYNFSKLKLDKIEDHHLSDYSASQATKLFRKDKNSIVFYIVDNEKENPYAPTDNYNFSSYKTLRPGILAVTVGGDFVGIDQVKTAGTRSYSKTLGKAKETAIGGNKNYSGWDATGLATLKRISEVADRAIVINMQEWRANVRGLDARGERKNRADAKSGAIAFKSDADFKKANLARYREILATKASKLPLDKVVEDTINMLTKHISDGIKKGETTKYGDLKLGEDKRGRDIKITDASNMMSNILSDYERYVSAVTNMEREKEEGYSSGYYERSSKEYAKNISDRVKKVKDMDYAW